MLNRAPDEQAPSRLAALGAWSKRQAARAAHGGNWTLTKVAAAPWKWIGIWVAAMLGVLILALVLFITFADWNAFRGPIGQMASTAAGRPIVIAGNLEVHPWSWTPEIRLHDLRIGNPPRFSPRGQFATVADADANVQLLPLLIGHFDVVRLDLRGADIKLYRGADGDANWASAPSAARSGKQANAPAIRQFSLVNGRLEYIDEKRQLSLNAHFATAESADPRDPSRFSLNGDGRINQRPFSLTFAGAPLINVQRNRPYAFTADIHAGDTHIEGSGAIAHPFDLNNWSADLRATGSDLADLYTLTGLTLPNTPPYALHGRLVRNGDTYGMPQIGGRIGDSDIVGNFEATHRSDGRLFLTGAFRSASLDFDDLMTVLGAPPSIAAGETASLRERQAAANLAAQGRLLPDARLDISRVRNMDARVSYRAAHVSSTRFPLRGLALDITLDHGLLRLDPMTLDLAQGRIGGSVSINARQATPHADLDIRLSGARMESVLALDGNPPLTGPLLGRVHLSGSGASVGQVAANADGDITLAAPSGEVRESLAELTGIDVTRGLGLLLTHNQSKIDVRCAVASFHVADGIARANTIVFDTETMLIHGEGQVSLRDETFDLRIRGEPKEPRLVRIAAPIEIQGRLRAPHVSIDAGHAVGQGGIAALLASVVAPLAAVLPFVDTGLAHDANCQQLLARAHAPAAVARTGRG